MSAETQAPSAPPAAPIPTREMVEQLKASWYHDPCWDLETTQGFEAYAAELREFSACTNANWERNRVTARRAAIAERAAAIVDANDAMLAAMKSGVWDANTYHAAVVSAIDRLADAVNALHEPLALIVAHLERQR